MKKKQCKNYPFNYFLCFLIIIIFSYQTVILQKKKAYEYMDIFCT